ncbi:Transcriptional regulator [Bacillus pseudomycoides]|nr:hypothetical protein bmyco0002_42400 [Bacillus pseudomycoides]EEM08928.1 hypothetical protein bmyco0003_43590 [Bacillus pseudomycoides]
MRVSSKIRISEFLKVNYAKMREKRNFFVYNKGEMKKIENI